TRYLFGVSSARGNAKQRPECAGRENDLAVRSPTAASRKRRVGQRQRRAAIDVDAPQLRAGEEGDGLSIGRPEGRRRAVRSLDLLRFDRGDVAHPERLALRQQVGG